MGGAVVAGLVTSGPALGSVALAGATGLVLEAWSNLEHKWDHPDNPSPYAGWSDSTRPNGFEEPQGSSRSLLQRAGDTTISQLLSPLV